MRSISSTPARTSSMVSQASGSGAAKPEFACCFKAGRAGDMGSIWRVAAPASTRHGVAGGPSMTAAIGANAHVAGLLLAGGEPDSQPVIAGAGRRHCDRGAVVGFHVERQLGAA